MCSLVGWMLVAVLSVYREVRPIPDESIPLPVPQLFVSRN